MTEHFCGCCGREIGAGTRTDPDWCAECKPHIRPGGWLIAPWDRTYFAQYRTDCPYQVGGVTEGCWENWASKRTVSGASRSWPQNGPFCGDTAPCPDAECSRPPGHSGRHMASLGAAWGHAVVAAWPGSHPPVKADLS